MRFELSQGKWYACELIGDEFYEDKCSYSPIKVFEVTPLKTGKRQFRLRFYHANYPAGVQGKEYGLQTIERGRTFMLAKSYKHDRPRYLQIYDITAEWVMRQFPGYDPRGADLQEWLDRNV